MCKDLQINGLNELLVKFAALFGPITQQMFDVSLPLSRVTEGNVLLDELDFNVPFTVEQIEFMLTKLSITGLPVSVYQDILEALTFYAQQVWLFVFYHCCDRRNIF